MPAAETTSGQAPTSGEVLSLVGMLDGPNRHRFRNDAELFAAWESVSKVRGPFRPQVSPMGPKGLEWAAPCGGG